MTKLTPYLNFNGQCAEAFRFYEQLLGGKIDFMQTHGGSPMKDQVPLEMRDKVMHASLQVGDSTLMASDVPPGFYSPPQGNFVSIHVTSPSEAERIFTALAKNGKVSMPLGETFWSPAFGMVTDRFGTPWMVNCAPEPQGT